MSVPQPPFHSVSEELLYNIYLKFGDMESLKESDINTLAKLNAILTDGDLMKSEEITSLINTLKGNVPEAGNSLEKLFSILQGLHYLKAEDIDTLAELNAIITNADVVSTSDLSEAIQALKGNVPVIADTLEKLYNSVWLADGNTHGVVKPLGTKDTLALPFITSATERARITASGQFLIGLSDVAEGLEGYKLQVKGDNALAVLGNVAFQEGSININLGKAGTQMANSFRINSYVAGLGGFEFLLSASNNHATLEIGDAAFGGTRNEMIRLSPAGYANTGILIRPNDTYNTTYGYRYQLEGTNTGQQGRMVSAFHAQLNFPLDDSSFHSNKTQLFVASASVTNHILDGFYADVSGSNINALVHAFYAANGKSRFRDTAIDGTLQLQHFDVPNHGKIYTDNVFMNFVSGDFRGMQFWTSGGAGLLLRLGNSAILETGAGLIHGDSYLDDAGGKGYLMIDGAKYSRSGTIWWGDPVGEASPRENSLSPNATRSLGARLILKRINAVNTGDYGIGYEPDFLWLSCSRNDNANGFKFYGKDKQVLKLLGDGNLISPSAAAHYFGDEDSNGTWRVLRSGEDLVFQKREQGNYVTKQTIQ